MIRRLSRLLRSRTVKWLMPLIDGTVAFALALTWRPAIGPVAPPEAGIWLHSQCVFDMQRATAELVSLPPEKVRLIHTPSAGCYGQNGANDVTADAALIAKAMPGHPIRLPWIGEQKFGSYPILRFAQVPDLIDVAIMNRPGMPFLGTEETAQGPASAALANAGTGASGARLRDMPMTPARLKAAIGVAGRASHLLIGRPARHGDKHDRPFRPHDTAPRPHKAGADLRDGCCVQHSGREHLL